MILFCFSKELVSANALVNAFILAIWCTKMEETTNVDLDYQMNIVLKINKYLTTNIQLQAIYDDNAFRGFQTRQVFGVAVNYGF